MSVEADDPGFRPPALTYGGVFLRFLRFGVMAFGGPVAQIAMVRRELVEEEGWISGPRFNRLLAVMQALPGPEAHELCVHLGMRARGRIGGLLAGLGFMLPGFVLMTLAAWAYFRFDIAGSAFAAALLGAQAAVIALIVRATHKIGEHVLLDRWLGSIGLLAGVAALFAVPFWIVLPGGAAACALARSGRGRAGAGLLVVAGVAVGAWILAGDRADEASVAVVGSAAAGAAGWVGLFGSGLKAGLLTFGGAYTAIPFVRQDLVGRGWLADGTFLDGLAVANVLPAPLIIFATFAGYGAGGLVGAMAMTAGVFLPAFAFSLVLYDRLEAVVSAPGVRAALDGAAAAVVGIIAATAISLAAGLYGGSSSGPLLIGVSLAALAALYLVKSRYAAPAVLAAAGMAGLILL